MLRFCQVVYGEDVFSLLSVCSWEEKTEINWIETNTDDHNDSVSHGHVVFACKGRMLLTISIYKGISESKYLDGEAILYKVASVCIFKNVIQGLQFKRITKTLY